MLGLLATRSCHISMPDPTRLCVQENFTSTYFRERHRMAAFAKPANVGTQSTSLVRRKRRAVLRAVVSNGVVVMSTAAPWRFLKNSETNLGKLRSLLVVDKAECGPFSARSESFDTVEMTKSAQARNHHHDLFPAARPIFISVTHARFVEFQSVWHRKFAANAPFVALLVIFVDERRKRENRRLSRAR
jgi:hypothetical protein